ncbi:MAG TPA: two-component regulator propeller domain-containing protein [Pyrinomonadaceae bacterium]|jgi:ligand-binding sensor domain-containing protein/signal transduction histidine kinase|nr:two-component regulator propeller domain-containing protein [Pyrinomonadaceae bacterium]
MRLPDSPGKCKALFLRLLLLLLILCGARALALDPHRQLGQFSRRVWQTENGLPQNSVRSVIQTRDGYVWAATEEGLARFDGLGFVVFDKQNTPPLKSNDARAVLEDREGALWVSTAGGLIRLFKGLGTSFTTQQGLPSDDVELAYEDRAGDIWVGTSDGLSRFHNGAFDNFTTRDGLAGNSVQALFEDTEGALWVGTTGGLSRYRDGRFVSFGAGDGLAGASVDAVEQGADGCLWLGTPDGLSCYRDGRFRNYTVREGLPNDRVISLRADREGSLWVGTAGGLSRFQGGRFETFGTTEGLAGNIILSIFEDAEGNLWVGTESGGLSQLRDKKFTTYTTAEGLASDLVKSVYEDRKGNIWVGTYGGGLSLLSGGKVTNYTTRDGLASNIVLALADDAEGSLWVGTPDGLSRLRGGKFDTYTSADGLPNDFVRSIHADAEGSLWVGTRGGLARLKDGVFTSYTTREGLPSDFVGTIYADAQGRLWVGTLGGLSRFADGKFTNYTTRDGLSDNVVISIYGDAEGRLWIGTNGAGLNLFKDEKFKAFTTRDGLPNDTIYRILEDGRGRLWMSCNKGIFRLSKSELEDFAEGRTHALNPVVYGTADGMATRECSGGGQPSGWRGGDGRLWFSTIKGLAMIDPERLASNEQPPPTVVEQFRVDGEPVAPSPGLALAPGKTRFDFYYAGLSFVAPEKVRYKYRLEGFDKDWVDGGDRRVAYYTNLGPGDYRFEVIACNNDGVWSRAPAAFAFRLEPHFYRTLWFYAFCALGLALLAWQVYALRLRQVRARFGAVLQERNRIAREIHDNLAQEILGVSVQLEIVARLMPSSTGAARTHLDRARALVRSSIAEARRYVWDLRSQSLEDRDLPTALSEMTRRLTAGSGVQTQFQVGGTFRPLPAQVENNLLRIGQEAVNNAVRHARAQTISVQLSFDTGSVRLSVSDDGRGFDPGNHSNGSDGHFGIVGMRERAEEVGGSVNIESGPGEGSEVSVSIPVEG